MIKERWETLRESKNHEESNAAKEIAAMESGKVVKESGGKVFDHNTQILDIRNLKATDLKNNKRVILPNLNDDENEIRSNHIKNELKDVFLNYKKKNCDKSGNVLNNNLSTGQINAIRSLKTKMAEENLICYKTDKTGKLALDTVQNYSEKIEKHIKDDKIVSPKSLRKIENELNKHADFWSRMTQAGEKTGQVKRIRRNVITKDNQIPILSGTSKDHKKSVDEKKGPDVRPIMGAMVGPNIGLAKFGNLIVRKVADEADVGHVSKSTEETIAKIEEYNKGRNKLKTNGRKIIIGSMDVEKWYPNMIAKPSAEEIREMVVESEINFEGFDLDVVSLYLGEFLTKEEIIQEGMEEILYIKKEKAKMIRKKYAKNVTKKHVPKMKKANTKKKSSVLKRNQGKDTNVIDDRRENIAHKKKLRITDNITPIDGNDT